MGGPARTPHEVASSCQVIYFYFYLASGILWVIYLGETSKADASAPGLLSWSIDDVSSDNRYSMDHNKRRNNMDRDNLKYTNVVLERLAAALEEILRLVKQDQEKFQKINEKN
jgi:hypothetical protein